MQTGNSSTERGTVAKSGGQPVDQARRQSMTKMWLESMTMLFPSGANGTFVRLRGSGAPKVCASRYQSACKYGRMIILAGILKKRYLYGGYTCWVILPGETPHARQPMCPRSRAVRGSRLWLKWFSAQNKIDSAVRKTDRVLSSISGRAIFDLHNAVSQFRQDETDKSFHWRRVPPPIRKETTLRGAGVSSLGAPTSGIGNSARHRHYIDTGLRREHREEFALGALFFWTGGSRSLRSSGIGKIY